ncbi:MAG: asparagine synthase (glutamine-hydrolyzing) [Elusimicrobia bacterium]|nr:asparagine synthase (glutamine-hydrolyzing) [Elusimicrobiota bacterium]
MYFGKTGAVDASLLKRMNDLLIHRGPDDEGFYREGGVGLAMRRLSIIDLSTGNQPMQSQDQSTWVVFNGEIYNFLELRPNLEKRGYRFKTKSDTEVILALYQEMGLDFVQKLRGMFTLALWDKKRERLVLARDRLGKKPLLYTLQPGLLAFASEMRSLLILPGVSKEIDPVALDIYLSLQYIPSPRTIFKSVSKLPPAHLLVLEKGKVEIRRYWDLPLGQTILRPDLEETKRQVREKLKESVRLRMISDVPLGAFLSGGVDSSCVVALMSELSAQPVKTFSIGFEEEEFSELPYAREVAERYGCDHHEMIVKPEMAEVLPRLAWHYGEPYADASALPSYYVARETRRHVTVALNGDGGDENFAGYLRYRAMKAMALWDRMPTWMRKSVAAGAELLPERNAPYDFLWRVKRFIRSAAMGGLPARHLKMLCYFNEDEKAPLYSEHFKRSLPDSSLALKYLSEAFAKSSQEGAINQLLYVDFVTYLPECLMAKMDIATMANSLEGRSPFLDHEFVEFAFRLPGNLKLKGFNQAKWILKEAMKDALPPTIRRRGKMGFGIPLGPWFREKLKKYWEEHVLSSRALARGYFKEQTLRGLFEEHVSGKRDHGYRLWALLMLELWHQQYMD